MQSRARRALHRLRRQRDDQFALAWADVEEASTEELERVAVRRACEGSDVLLIFLLKARRPEKYRDNVHVQHSGHVDHDLKRMTARRFRSRETLQMRGFCVSEGDSFRHGAASPHAPDRRRWQPTGARQVPTGHGPIWNEGAGAAVAAARAATVA